MNSSANGTEMNTLPNDTEMDIESNEQVRFTPSNYEQDDPALIKLFKDVEHLISNFLEEEKSFGVEDQVRRYIAGHVCHEILNEVRGKMTTFKSKRNVNPYSIYVQEELEKHNQMNEAKVSIRSTEKMKEINAAYEILKKTNAKERERLLAKAEYERQDLKTLAMDVKRNRFLRDWKALKENLGFFRENYRTHMVLVCATDTKYDTYYKTAILVNSEISGHAVDQMHDEMPGMSLNGILESTVIREGIFAGVYRKFAYINAARSYVPAYSLAPAHFPAPAHSHTPSPVFEYEDIENESDSSDPSFVPRRRLRSSAEEVAENDDRLSLFVDAPVSASVVEYIHYSICIRLVYLATKIGYKLYVH